MQIKNKKNIFKLSAVSLVSMLGFGTIISSNQITPTYANNGSDVETIEAITLETDWKYLDNNTDPANNEVSKATQWTTPTFDDSDWSTNHGTFGAKNGKIADLGNGCTPTVLLNQYINGSNGNVIPTYFFRTTIDVDDIEDITSITGSLKADDGIIVYLNGQQVVTDNMNVDGKGVISEPNMYYAGNSNGDPVQKEFTLDKASLKDKLVEGENTIAVELHNDRDTSSDIYFEFTNLNINSGEDIVITQKAISLQIGSNETENNITWYANNSTTGEVQVAKKEESLTNDFPSKYQTFVATTKNTNDANFYSNQATITNLEENTEYVYRVVNDTVVSDTYTFTTGDFDEGFNFLLAGDPQIGASGNSGNDTTAWDETLSKTVPTFKPDFIVSAGDQVNTASDEGQYTGYLQSDEMKSIPSAPTIGNHDSSSTAYSEHFNLPNDDSGKGNTTAGGDYWYVYDNTLFMDINTNNRSTAEHKAFMEEAIASNPGVRWKTVVFHHSIYSTASHVSDEDIIQRRNELPAVFDELDIDVVLMGHDYVYTRTYMMNGMTPDTTNGVESSVIDPTGILYLTANSASGSKYYGFDTSYDTSFAAVKDQSRTKTITNIEVTDNAYTMTTYYVDNMQIVDTFTINKTPNAANKTSLEQKVNEFSTLKADDYTATSWQLFESAMQDAKLVLESPMVSQEEVDTALTDLMNAKEALVKKK
ncbi:MAG: fibronectin type III domain-containing protein [Coprobacillaceae bacterium]